MPRKPPSPEETRRILSDLRGKTLVVEGVRDEKALKTLGLNNIIKINRKPLYQVAREISFIARAEAKEVVILTDFDREGRALASRLTALLEPRKIRINRRLRGKIMEFGKPEIENLSLFQEKAQAKRSWSSKLGPTSKFKEFREDDLHVKVGTGFDKVRYKGKDKGEGRSGKT